jgi:hypothetical protein
MTRVGAEKHSTEEEIERITRAYADRVDDVDRGDVEATVRAEFDRWSTVAISDFVPIFVERSVRSHYRLIGTTGN